MTETWINSAVLKEWSVRALAAERKLERLPCRHLRAEWVNERKGERRVKQGDKIQHAPYSQAPTYEPNRRISDRRTNDSGGRCNACVRERKARLAGLADADEMICEIADHRGVLYNCVRHSTQEVVERLLQDAVARARMEEHDAMCPECHPFEYLNLLDGKYMKKSRIVNRCARGCELEEKADAR